MTRLSLEDLYSLKARQEKIVSLSCYTYPVAQIADSLCEVILVGDSVGMVLYGMESTNDVTLEMMIAHGKAVTKATKKAFIIIDMPAGSYEADKKQALTNAQKIIAETNAQAVKIEGGTEIAETIQYLTQHKINVVAHIGLTPQSFSSKKDFRIQGRTDDSQTKLINDIINVTEAGACLTVIEGVTKEAADKLCKATKTLTIGIGATNNCDGQILVIDDIIGSSNYIPKFAKIYEDSSQLIRNSLNNFRSEVKGGIFPSEDNMY